MKTKLPFLLLICLASCSHTPPAFESLPEANTAAVPTESMTPPPGAVEEVTAPAVVIETNAPAVAIESTEPAFAAVAPAAVVPAPIVPIPAVPGGTSVGSNAAPSPFARPPQPAIPAMNAAVPTAPPPRALREEVISAGLVDFRGADLTSVLQLYCQMINRTLLRPQALPDVKIYLKNQTELTKSEMLQAFESVLALNGITMLKFGDKFVKAVPFGQAGQEGTPFSKETAEQLPDLGSYATHVIQLKYSKPSELVQVLQPFAKIPNSIQPIDSSGILVLRDYTENVKRMLELVAQIDIAVPAEYTNEVIMIKYTLASDISAALNSLSTGGGGTTVGAAAGGAGGGVAGGARPGGLGARPGMGGTTGQSGSTYPGGINRGMNTPGGTGGIGGGGGGPGGGTFGERLQNIIRRASVSGEIQILGQTKIIADERTNSLLIFASRADMEVIKDIVRKLDVVLAQVLIEAIIMEVSLDNSRNLGVSAAQTRPINGTKAIGGFNNGQPFFPFDGNSGSNSFPGNFAGALPGNNLSYWGRLGGTFDVAVQAIAADGRVNVLSRPRIQTSHGVEADLFVGQTVPYITGTTFNDFGGGGSRSQYQEKQIGITLKVKPLINPDGLVVMDIYQEIGQPGATPVTIDGNPVPIINQRQASATVAVKDHDTIILGGMIGTTKNKTRSGVPYLKDIPLLGALFRSTSDSEQRTELIVLLRPTVLPTPEAAAIVADAERMALPGVRRAEAEIHEEEARRLKQAEKELDNPKKKSGSVPK